MFLDLLSTRRSIREFKPRRVEKEKIDRLIEAALRSFSSRSINPWQFIVIDDPALLARLSKLKPHGSSFLKTAPLGIAVMADTTLSDVWVEDTAIASALVHLTAHDIGLGSCWIQVRNRSHSEEKSSDAFVKELLGVPDNISIESIIAIGYSEAPKKGHDANRLDYTKVSWNRFDRKD